MTKDRFLIFISAGLRATAVGLSGVILAVYLATVGMNAQTIGLAISVGLAGCAFGTLSVTYLSDHWGRRKTLALVSFLMAAGGVALVLSDRSSVILVSAFFGMVNGMGRDRGAGLTIEQAMIPQTTTEEKRTQVFAWYNVFVDSGHAVGSLLGGTPALLRSQVGFTAPASYHWTWGMYALICLIAGAFAFLISESVELKMKARAIRLSPESRKTITKFAALSSLDSLGGGFLTSALVGYWFFKRFGVDEALLGPLFFAVRIMNGLSHLGAAWIAQRIGLVNTMVFTHIPSSLLLMTVPFAPNLPVAILLFLLRESLVEMDVPTRQSYIVAVVKEEERTKAAGITNLTRNVSWAVAPVVAGSMMRAISLSAPLFFGPALKIAYDLLLYREFRHLKPPEERS